MTPEIEEKKKKVKKSLKVITSLLFVLFVGGIVCFLIYYSWLIKTPVNADGSVKYFEVKENTGVFEVSSNLKQKGLIMSDWAFFINTKIKSKSLQPGVYELSAKMSTQEVLDVLSSGKTKIVKITIPEGYRAEQIAQVVADNGISTYDEFLQKAELYRGKLFPDTYYATPKNTAEDIIKLMVDNFESKTKDLNLSDDDLILASIVEREAINDKERSLIAGIYKNRLSIDMKLQADPTVQYGKDNILLKKLDSSKKENFDFWSKITIDDYDDVDSLYNTYLISGLPPTPICNPGIASIKGVINYDNNNYYYFLQRDGKIYPSETLNEHNKNRENVLGVRFP